MKMLTACLFGIFSYCLKYLCLMTKVQIKMCDEKRKRSPNWLRSEKILLLDLVAKHFGVIENKKTDGVSIKAKLAEWQIISVEYNSQTSHCHREAENLKSQWENMKKVAKKEASHARMRKIQTGGGPPDPKKEDLIYLRRLSLIKTSAAGLYNPFDNDSEAPVQANSETVTATGSESEYLSGSCNINLKKIVIDQPLPVKDIEIDQPLLEEDIEIDHSLLVEDINGGGPTAVDIKVKDWGDYTPQLLKTPLSAQLKTAKNYKSGISRRRPLHTPVSSSLELLHKHKIEAINLQKSLAAAEAEEKKTISGLDIEIKKEILKQEKLKTKLLLLELRKKKKECK